MSKVNVIYKGIKKNAKRKESKKMLNEYLYYLQENTFKEKIQKFLNLLQKEPIDIKSKRTDLSPKEKSNIKKIRFLKLFDKLKIPKDEALIMGSSVLVLHGLLEKNEDLDLIVTRHTLNGMRKNKDFVRDYKYNKVFYKTPSGSIEAAVNFQILDKKIDTLLDGADIVEGYRFMTLRNTYKMYLILNRPKDSDKLRKLKDYYKRNTL